MLWSLLFFRMHRPDLALIEVAALWASIAALILFQLRRSPLSAALLAPYLIWVSIAAALVAVSVWLSYRWSDRVLALLGQAGARVVSRLVAFLLLCVGVQIIWTGLDSLLAGRFPLP